MIKVNRCSFCQEAPLEGTKLVTSPVATDLIGGFNNVRTTTICESCVLTFTNSTVRCKELVKSSNAPCQFCGQNRAGAALTGAGVAKICTECSALIIESFDRYSEFHLKLVLCPRLFVSYSHESQEHKEWVIAFVARLRSRNIAVLYDYDHLNGKYHTPTTADIGMLIQRVQCCHVFLPVFTLTYLFGIGYGTRPEYFPSDKRDPQWVFDEFQESLQMSQAGRIEIVAVLRAGEFNALPRPFTSANTLDLRTENKLSEKLDKLSEHLVFERAIKVAPYLDDKFIQWA